MSDEVLLTERLEKSIERLEKAVAERISDTETAVDQRISVLEADLHDLKSKLQSVTAEKDALASALDDVKIDYRVLENVTDTVRDRLDGTIGRLREVLSV
jgi:chromosome segregation ATPase